MNHKHYLLYPAILLLMACNGTGPGADTSPAQSTLLQNAGFEASELSPWTFAAHADGTAFTTELDREVKYRGDQSLRIDATGREPWGGIRQIVTDPVFAEGGTWKLSVWLRGHETSEPVRAFILVRGGRGAPPREQVLQHPGSNYDWQRAEWQFDIPEGTQSVHVGITHYGLGTLWVDDVVLEPVR